MVSTWTKTQWPPLSTYFRFAKQYNEIIENEVKNRKMWLDENESWMNINDNDVDELAGFAKKLEEQKVPKLWNNCPLV